MKVRELLRGEGVGVGQEIGKGEGGYHPRRGSATKVQTKRHDPKESPFAPK